MATSTVAYYTFKKALKSNLIWYDELYDAITRESILKGMDQYAWPPLLQYQNKLRCLPLPFNSTLVYYLWARLGAYHLSGSPQGIHSDRFQPCLQILDKGGNKHFSLLRYCNNYCCKKFYSLILVALIVFTKVESLASQL